MQPNMPGRRDRPGWDCRFAHSGQNIIMDELKESIDWRGRINLVLGAAAFTISSAGSVLLHIVLAVAIYEETGSGLTTAMFVSLQWLPVFIVILYRSDWDFGMEPRRRWYLLDLTSAVLTLFIIPFVLESNYLAIVLLLLLRGLFDHVSRITKTVIAPYIFPGKKLSYYASFMQSGYHLGIALASVAGVFLISSVSLETAVIIDSATFLVSAALVYLIRNISEDKFPPSGQRNSIGRRCVEYLSCLREDPRLFFCCMLPPLTAAFFQGTYSVLQPIFPGEQFSLGPSAVSASYVMASIAIVAGSSGFALFCKYFRIFDRDFSAVILVALGGSLFACGSYMVSVYTSSVIASAVFFTAMVFLFEFVWMLGYSGIVTLSPKKRVGSVFAITFAVGCLLGSVMALGVGGLLDILGNNFVYTVGIFMAAYSALILASYALYRRWSFSLGRGQLSGVSAG